MGSGWRRQAGRDRDSDEVEVGGGERQREFVWGTCRRGGRTRGRRGSRESGREDEMEAEDMDEGCRAELALLGRGCGNRSRIIRRGLEASALTAELELRVGADLYAGGHDYPREMKAPYEEQLVEVEEAADLKEASCVGPRREKGAGFYAAHEEEGRGCEGLPAKGKDHRLQLLPAASQAILQVGGSDAEGGLRFGVFRRGGAGRRLVLWGWEGQKAPADRIHEGGGRGLVREKPQAAKRKGEQRSGRETGGSGRAWAARRGERRGRHRTGNREGEEQSSASKPRAGATSARGGSHSPEGLSCAHGVLARRCSREMSGPRASHLRQHQQRVHSPARDLLARPVLWLPLPLPAIAVGRRPLWLEMLGVRDAGLPIPLPHPSNNSPAPRNQRRLPQPRGPAVACSRCVCCDETPSGLCFARQREFPGWPNRARTQKGQW